jgi:hypothetical protein
VSAEYQELFGVINVKQLGLALIAAALLLGLAIFNQLKIERALADWGIGVDEEQQDAGPKSLVDLHYGDRQLDALMNEIAQHSDNAALLAREISWLSHRANSCPHGSPVPSEQKCELQMNAAHLELLRSKLVELLLEFKPSVLPGNVQVPEVLAGTPISSQQRKALAYAPDSGILAAVPKRGDIIIANLLKGTVVSSIPTRNQQPFRGTGVSLSPNGRLVLLNNETASQLISTYTGAVLRDYDHPGDNYLQFTRSGRHIVQYDGYQIAMIDTVTGETLDRRPQQLILVASLPHSGTLRLFDPATNSLINWSRRGKRISVLKLLKGNQPDIHPGKQYDLPASLRGKLENVALNTMNNSLLLLTRTGIHELDRLSGGIRRVGPLDFQPRGAKLLPVGFHLYISGKSELKSRQEFASVNLRTGQYAFLGESFGGVSNLLALPSGWQYLAGTDRGLTVRRVEVPAELYISLGEARKEKEVRAYQAAGVDQPAEAARQATGNAMYKCRTANGRISYSDSPCSSDAISTRVQMQTAPPPTSSKETKLGLVGPGSSGVGQAVRAGILRPATDADLDRWRVMSRDNAGRDTTLDRIKMLEKYVLQKPARFSGGLSGSNAMVFIVTRREHTPIGNLGHSAVLYTYSGACTGAMCGR